MLNTALSPRVIAAMGSVDAGPPLEGLVDVLGLIEAAKLLIEQWSEYTLTIEEILADERFFLEVCQEEPFAEEMLALWQAMLENEEEVDYADSCCDRLRYCVPDSVDDRLV